MDTCFQGIFVQLITAAILLSKHNFR